MMVNRISRQVSWLVEMVMPVLFIFAVVFVLVHVARWADAIQAALGGGQ